MTGALPMIIANTAKSASSSVITIVKDLFKNRGVQLGTGLGITGLGIAGLGAGAKSATEPFGELSPIIVIGVVIVFLIILMRAR